MLEKEWKISEVDRLFDGDSFRKRLRGIIQQGLNSEINRRVRGLVAGLAACALLAGGLALYFGHRIILLQEKASLLDQKLHDESTRLGGFVKAAELSALGSVEQAKQSSSAARSQLSVMSKSNRDFQDSTDKLFSEIKKSNQSIDGMHKTLESYRSTMPERAKGIKNRAETLEELICETNEAGKLVAEQERKLSNELQSMKGAQLQFEEAAENLDSLGKKIGDVSDRRTFEFVTLRSKSSVNLKVTHIEETDGMLSIKEYGLTFTLPGYLSKNFTLFVEVDGPGEGQKTRYPNLHFEKKDSKREYYCICGTPLTFQIDNFVKSPFLSSFVVLKVRGNRDRNCKQLSGCAAGGRSTG